MTDRYSDCQSAYVAQLKTLATTTTFFPATTGRSAGWQISENDTVVYEGGDYFVTYRVGGFSQKRSGQYQDNDWTVVTHIWMRYVEYDGAWTAFRQFRAAVMALPDTSPLTQHGIIGQTFRSAGNAGYVVDPNGSYLNYIMQSFDCIITQRAIQIRAM